MADKNKKTIGSPTQNFLKIQEIRGDAIIMNDGTLRAVIAVSSTNFDLKSQEEQDALIYSYQRFLNSLDFKIQILMQSRKMNIAEYTDKLRTMVDKQTNELLRMQTSEYIDFISRLVDSANVMSKNFYVIVPLEMTINPKSGGFFSSLFGNSKLKQITSRENSFVEYGKQLTERVNTVSSNLASSGMRVVRLNTDQLIELVYNSYNFGAAPAIDASQLPNVTITTQN